MSDAGTFWFGIFFGALFALLFTFFTFEAVHHKAIKNFEPLCQRLAEFEFQDVNVRQMASTPDACVERINQWKNKKGE